MKKQPKKLREGRLVLKERGNYSDRKWSVRQSDKNSSNPSSVSSTNFRCRTKLFLKFYISQISPWITRSLWDPHFKTAFTWSYNSVIKSIWSRKTVLPIFLLDRLELSIKNFLNVFNFQAIFQAMVQLNNTIVN